MLIGVCSLEDESWVGLTCFHMPETRVPKVEVTRVEVTRLGFFLSHRVPFSISLHLTSHSKHASKPRYGRQTINDILHSFNRSRVCEHYQPRPRCVLTCSSNLSFLGSPLSPTRLHPGTGQGKSSRYGICTLRCRVKSSLRVNEVRCPLFRQPGYKQIQGLLERQQSARLARIDTLLGSTNSLLRTF